MGVTTLKDSEQSKTFGMTKQQVRVIDIFILSPFLLWASTQTNNKIAKNGLVFVAIATILYNATNYIKAK